jgi:hypothetical protein
MDLKSKTPAELASLEKGIARERERRIEESEEQYTSEAKRLTAPLLALLPHSGKCSDSHLDPSLRKRRPRCIRCFLLDSKNEEYMPMLSMFDVSVEVVVAE